MKLVKSIFAIGLFCLLSLSLSAQTQTLLGDGIQTVSGFGGPTFAISKVEGQNTYWIGGQGGAVFNERLILGGGGMQMINEKSILNRDAHMNLGGVLLGYIFMPERKVHITASVLAGGGNISEGSEDFDTFTSLTPQIDLEANLTHYFRIGVGVSQHFFYGLESPLYPSAASLSRPMLGVSLRFGAF